MNKCRFPRSAGFTLVEAIIVIVVTGILAGIVAIFIRTPVEGYIDSVRRAEMTDAADTALRRIARDARTALPNSFRRSSDGSTACIEFLPTLGGGRYRAAYASDGTGDILDFTQAITKFDALASNNLPASFKNAPTQHVVIYNLGSGNNDAYAGNNRAQIDTSAASTASNANIVLTAGKQFPFESPGKRFHVISDYSVVYSCANGTLLRSTRAINAAALASCPAAGGTVLVTNVDCANTFFEYTDAVSARYGLLALTLKLTHPVSLESISLYHEIQVSNVP